MMLLLVMTMYVPSLLMEEWAIQVSTMRCYVNVLRVMRGLEASAFSNMFIKNKVIFMVMDGSLMHLARLLQCVISIVCYDVTIMDL